MGITLTVVVAVITSFLTALIMMRLQLKMFECWINKFFERELEEIKKLIR